MLQWVTTISFLVGICLAHMGLLSWHILLLLLGLGLILLCLQFFRKGFPLFTLIWNVTLAGALWYSIRNWNEGSDQTNHISAYTEQVSTKTSSFAHERMLQSGLSEEEVSVLNAMLLGNRKGLTYEQKMRFRGAGAQHLLALSGLHLGIFLGVFSFLFLRRARHSRYRWIVLLCTLSLLWSYCIMAGMPQSLLRAMLMATLYYLSLFATDESHADVNLANTLLLMLLIDPNSAFDIGTQLSFAAVGSIIWVYPVLSGIIPDTVFAKCGHLRTLFSRIWHLFMVSVAAWLGTLPLCLYYFHQMQPWQSVNSIVLIPLTTILLYLGIVLLLLSAAGLWVLAVPLATVVTFFMSMENKVLDLASQLPYSTIHCVDIHLGHVLLLYSLVFFMYISMDATRKIQKMGFLAILFTLLVLFLI